MINKVTTRRQWPAYNIIWRWHFYAGLLCIPLVIVLAVSGAVYLFKPQVDATLNQPYNHLVLTGAPQAASVQVKAALAAVPNTVLNAYQLPQTAQSAVQVLLGQRGDLIRVYVHPQTLEILKIEHEDDKLMQVAHELHGNLLIGDWGSYLVELAASWAIVMLITGLYLWLPTNTKNLAGILYPRLKSSQRVFWRDLHAVTGFWIAFFTLFLLVSGLPWAKSWGGLLKEVRHFSLGKVVEQDWTTGPSSALAERQKMNMPAMSDAEHAEHMKHQQMANKLGSAQFNESLNYHAIDRLVATVQPLGLAYPVLISPPSRKSPDWTAKSNAQNRPLRSEIVLDGQTGVIKSRKDFADRPLLDRIIGYGVAIHEGQLFGWFNQLLGLITALGLVLISISGVVLWWRRRIPNSLGAPARKNHVGEPKSMSYVPISTIVLLGLLLPFLGLSVIAILLVERYVLRYIPAASSFLGLD